MISSLYHPRGLKLLALWPSGMPRSGGSPRLSHSRGNMAESCGTWKSKSSKRRAEVKLTSSLAAKLLCASAQCRAQRHAGGFLPCFVGADTSVSPICPVTKDLPSGGTVCPSRLLPCQWPSSLPGPKDGILSQILSRACLLAEPHPRQLQKGPPAPNSKRSHLGTKCSSQAACRGI